MTRKNFELKFKAVAVAVQVPGRDVDLSSPFKFSLLIPLLISVRWRTV